MMIANDFNHALKYQYTSIEATEICFRHTDGTSRAVVKPRKFNLWFAAGSYQHPETVIFSGPKRLTAKRYL